jgi:hypothetical protein
MKAYGDSGGIVPPFLISSLEGGEWSASRPRRSAAKETAPGTHDVERAGGPQSLCRRFGDEKNLLPLLGIEPYSSVVQPIAESAVNGRELQV